MFLFEVPLSKDHFIEYVKPILVHTLSLTLKHFHVLAGNLAFPPTAGKPEIRYKDGDSVTLIFAESTKDFNHLVGNHERNATEFHPLLPQLPPGSMSQDETLLVPLTAIQMTHFPNHGIAAAFNINHAIGDGSSINNFIRSWGLILKSQGKETFLDIGILPCYDRAPLRGPTGIELETLFWNQMKAKKYQGPNPPSPAGSKVRVSFVMNQARVEYLKKLVMARFSSLSHASTFTVACGYVWSCEVKAREACGEEMDPDDETEYFRFQENCRSHLKPPLPANYFGNCLVACLATAKRSQLMGEDGYLVAANSIIEAMQKRLHNEEGVLNGAENWLSELEALKGKKIFGASSSPKFKSYNLDFGWGRCRKVEMIAIDDSGTMSLSDCMDAEGDLEIGLSFPKPKMDAFATFYLNGA
ncbi:hypothetical protein Tsubulata_048002 [Turnera subulata]|uniref:Uncharacterized protein n=1 Tax=Turnera subulata TaxID=218843 RepID=A0A9Q0GF54_9ROSI|nr:hypothetical protein Tsubulata_048002 [Turnera subulata]